LSVKSLVKRYQNIDHGTGNYTLRTTSPYKNTGTDGLDLGANVQAVNSAMNGVR
jgi:hypothetical protein